MIFYPTRARFTQEEFRKTCVDGEAWNLVDSIFTGKRAFLFLPGSLAFGAVGFLGHAPGTAILFFFVFAVFDSQPVAFRGYLAVFGIAFVVVVHALFMFRTNIGLVFAQQDLVRYLNVLLAVCCGLTVYGLFSGMDPTSVLFPIIGAVMAAFVLWLSRSISFALFAQIMRVKRIYLKYRDAERRALRK